MAGAVRMEKKLNVVALGGCGGMGSHAVRTALELHVAEEILVVDQDGARAREPRSIRASGPRKPMGTAAAKTAPSWAAQPPTTGSSR